jgi:hypothetical protein
MEGFPALIVKDPGAPLARRQVNTIDASAQFTLLAVVQGKPYRRRWEKRCALTRACRAKTGFKGGRGKIATGFAFPLEQHA